MVYVGRCVVSYTSGCGVHDVHGYVMHLPSAVMSLATYTQQQTGVLHDLMYVSPSITRQSHLTGG
jgi:hypothetical protein